MFQGMARGKVGDVVFSRLNGEQISRVRNRHPKNPRTNAQLYQRAIMATILQAYSAGKEIFDHSFQGRSVSEGNMREFMSENIKSLRSTIIADIDGNLAVTNQLGRVVMPKSTTPVPVHQMLVSKGSLTNNVITLKADASGSNAVINLAGSASATGKTAEAFFDSINVKAGDLFTIVAFVNNSTLMGTVPNVDTPQAKQYGCTFGFVRLRAKTTLSGNISEATTIGDLFEIESDGTVFSDTIATKTLIDAFGQGVDTLMNQIDGGAPTSGEVAVIRSREDSGERSTERTVGLGSNAYGIASQYILDAWREEVDALGNSDLILEGGNF